MFYSMFTVLVTPYLILLKRSSLLLLDNKYLFISSSQLKYLHVTIINHILFINFLSQNFTALSCSLFLCRQGCLDKRTAKFKFEMKCQQYKAICTEQGITDKIMFKAHSSQQKRKRRIALASQTTSGGLSSRQFGGQNGSRQPLKSPLTCPMDVLD